LGRWAEIERFFRSWGGQWAKFGKSAQATPGRLRRLLARADFPKFSSSRFGAKNIRRFEEDPVWLVE